MFVNIRNWDIPLQIVRGRLVAERRFSHHDGESGECKDIAATLLDFQKRKTWYLVEKRWEDTAWHTLTTFLRREHSRHTAGSPLGELGVQDAGSPSLPASTSFVRKNAAGPGAGFSTLRNVFVNVHPTHEAARAASSSSCRTKSLCININASSACTTYSCPPLSWFSASQKAREFDRVYGGTNPVNTNLLAISVLRLSVFPFCASVSCVTLPSPLLPSPPSFG